MKKINVIFELDDTLEGIDIIVRASAMDEDVEALLGRLEPSDAENVAVTDGGGKLEVIPASDIIMLSVNGKTVSIITEESRYTARQPLNSIESSLDEARFVRISRYEIINLAKVVRYDFTLAGTLRIELVGGIETWASRRCIPLIRKRLAGKGWR